MADTIRIRRRISGAPGAPSGLANAELAYNEVDHTLYYGEGTGGAGGTASVIAAVGGPGLGSNVVPLVNAGSGAAGTGTTWSRNDHVHPTDTSRYAASNPSGYQTAAQVTASLVPYATLANPNFTGIVTIGGTITGPGMTSWAAAPPAIGNTTPNTGAFTSLTASGSVSGAGFTALLAGYALTSGVPVVNTTTVPLIDGTAAIGTINGVYARPDHVHPTDTTRYAASNPSGYQTAAQVLAIRLDQFALPTTTVNFNTQLLQNLAEPSSPSDAATKHYVDGASQGLVSKAAVAAATAGANITLAGLQVIDGYTTNTGDRILVKDQTTQANNGIYVAAAGGWNRAADMNTWPQVPNAYVFVINGAVNISSSWTCTSTLTGGTINVTAITWVQFSQAAQALAGNGLNKVGNTFNVIGTAGRIVVGAAVDIDTGYVGQTSLVTLGSVTTGTWNANTIAVNRGGTGATTLTGYLVGNGTSAFSTLTQIPFAGVAGLGSMASQFANNVAITGGTIDGITLDGGTF